MSSSPRSWKMPERLPADGSVKVTLLEDDRLTIRVTTNGVEEAIVCSKFNAARVFAIIAFFLEIPIGAKLGKLLTFGPTPEGSEPLTMTFKRHVGQSFGERVADPIYHESFVKVMTEHGYDVQEDGTVTTFRKEPP